MKLQQQTISPQDIVILLKIITFKKATWNQLLLAEELFISQSEISKSLSRSKFAGLLDSSGSRVLKLALMEFLQYGIKYVFPQKPGAIVRGIPTAHSAMPLKEIIQSEENYVWSSAKGTVRGHSIVPLFPSVVNAVKLDYDLYELLALVDALRVGSTREKKFAVELLRERIIE